MPVETPTEIWLPVVGYEGWYEVSNLGRVKRVGAISGAVVGKILKPAPTRGGYLCVSLTRGDNKAKTTAIHRIISEAFLGYPKSGLEVNHKDGNKTNNCLDNLEYVTRSNNRVHAYRMGLIDPHKRKPTPIRPWDQGEKNPTAKLSNQEVILIRQLAKTHKQKDIAIRFGVAASTICGILKGRSYKYLQEEKHARSQ